MTSASRQWGMMALSVYPSAVDAGGCEWCRDRVRLDRGCEVSVHYTSRCKQMPTLVSTLYANYTCPTSTQCTRQCALTMHHVHNYVNLQIKSTTGTNQNSEQYTTHRLGTIYANPATGEKHHILNFARINFVGIK